MVVAPVPSHSHEQANLVESLTELAVHGDFFHALAKGSARYRGGRGRNPHDGVGSVHVVCKQPERVVPPEVHDVFAHLVEEHEEGREALQGCAAALVEPLRQGLPLDEEVNRGVRVQSLELFTEDFLLRCWRTPFVRPFRSFKIFQDLFRGALSCFFLGAKFLRSLLVLGFLCRLALLPEVFEVAEECVGGLVRSVVAWVQFLYLSLAEVVGPR